MEIKFFFHVRIKNEPDYSKINAKFDEHNF